MSAETITILVAVFGSITAQIAVLVTLVVRGDRHAKELREEMNRRFDDVNKRFEEVDRRFDDVNKRFDKRFDDVNKRFDETIREIAEQRERMARLEGSLDGFLAGRRDRDAA